MQKILTLSLFFLFSNTFSQSLSDLTFGGVGSFEVVTWNLEFFPKNNQTTIDSTALAISSLNADVYALQEIDELDALQELDDLLEDYQAYVIPENYNNLTLAYLVKKDIEVVNLNSIYASSSYNNIFAGRPPLLLELLFNGSSYFLINVHLKCCGDGSLNTNDSSDEENRRLQAVNQIKTYIDSYIPNEKVIVLGDYNDLLEDNTSNNVFQSLLDDSDSYLFADISVLDLPNSHWSFPNWPSHLDHILITNELFDEFNNAYNYATTIKMADYFTNGFYGYDNCISDHYPVGMRLWPFVTEIEEKKPTDKRLNQIRDIQGRITNPQHNQIQFYFYENGTVEKSILLD